MTELNVYQEYLIDEFADDYKERKFDRRELVRRVLLITGSVPLTATMLTALGCGGGNDEPSPSPPGAVAPTQAPRPTEAPAPAVVAQPTNDIEAEQVRFKAPASEMIAYRAKPRTGGPFPGVVIIHENRGLQDATRNVARMYAQEGFVGLAVDLLSRSGGTGSDQATSAGGLSRVRPEDMTADLLASVDYLKTLSFVKASALGVTGFCFGGGYTFELAVASPDIKAAVPYYGTARNVMDRLGNTRAAMFMVYAGNDPSITSQAPEVEQRLKAAGKIVEYKVYDGARHGFFSDTTSADSKDAWARTMAWFRKYLVG